MRVNSCRSSRARHFANTQLLECHDSVSDVAPSVLRRDSLRRRRQRHSACLAKAFAYATAPARRRLVGLSRFELLTPRLSSVCSNQLSYRPLFFQQAGGLRYWPNFHCQRAGLRFRPASRFHGLSAEAPSGAKADSLKTR